MVSQLIGGMQDSDRLFLYSFAGAVSMLVQGTVSFSLTLGTHLCLILLPFSLSHASSTLADPLPCRFCVISPLSA
jgi:hypothetical protein